MSSFLHGPSSSKLSPPSRSPRNCSKPRKSNKARRRATFRIAAPLWTNKNRAKYNRDQLRYPSDLTDDEWAYVEPLIPPAKRGGGKRRTDMRAVMNGDVYSEHRLPVA